LIIASAVRERPSHASRRYIYASVLEDKIGDNELLQPESGLPAGLAQLIMDVSTISIFIVVLLPFGLVA
jgi:hypothetical protein